MLEKPSKCWVFLLSSRCESANAADENDVLSPFLSDISEHDYRTGG
jgi:hypothetical protein